MTTATHDDLGYDDEGQDQPDEAEAKRQAFERRKQAKEERDREIAELREFKAKAERKEALDKARAELSATGPLGAFLRTYDGEPTADAIKAAVAADPDFADLVTFTPDPKDAAVAEMAANARKIGSSGVTSPELTAAEAHRWPMEKKARFREQHPELWEAMMAGSGPVASPAGWA